VIGIIGSRRRASPADYKLIFAAFERLYEPGDRIVSGGCPQGGDAYAEIIARQQQVPITIHYARWKEFGKRAGFVRNLQIATDADVLIACVAADRTGGTEDTIKKFQQIHQLTGGGEVILV
jgi:hypothetical protein